MTQKRKLVCLLVLFVVSCAVGTPLQADQLDQANAYAGQALTALNKNEVDKGIELFEKALQLQPQDYVIMTSLGGAYASYKQAYEKAIGLFKKAIEIKADYDLAHFGLAAAYADMGLKEEAIKEFENTLKITQRDNVKDFVNQALKQLKQE